jgi:hypothetical protein
MATTDYDRVLREAEALTPDDQRRLVQDISDRLRTRPEPGRKRPRLEDLAGMAPYPLCGEDAQKYISKMRDEWEEREKNR